MRTQLPFRSLPRLAPVLLILALGCGSAVEPPPDAWFSFASLGSRPGQVSRPRAVCVTQDGWLFVIDRTGRVLRFDRAGAYSMYWNLPDHENGTPTAITPTADGRLLIADTHYHRVLEYDQDGNLLRQWGEYGDGEGQFIYLTDVVLDDQGHYYVCEYGNEDRIQVFDAQRRFLRSWGTLGPDPGQLHRPMGLAFNSDHELHVADAINHRIQVFDRQGNLLRVLSEPGRDAGRLNYPYDVAVGGDDRVYVVEYGAHRFQVFSREGEWLGVHGGPGGADGQLANPWGLCFAAPDRVYVADYRNHRIHCWRMDPPEPRTAMARP